MSRCEHCYATTCGGRCSAAEIATLRTNLEHKTAEVESMRVVLSGERTTLARLTSEVGALREERDALVPLVSVTGFVAGPTWKELAASQEASITTLTAERDEARTAVALLSEQKACDLRVMEGAQSLIAEVTRERDEAQELLAQVLKGDAYEPYDLIERVTAHLGRNK